MKYKKTIFFILLISFNLISISNLRAFGVEGAMADNAAIKVAENSDTNKEVASAVSEPSSVSSMESEHIGNPESIEAGRAKYGNTCLFCHGPKGVGSRAPTLVTKGFKPGGAYDNDYFFTTIKYGRPGTIMGAMEGTLTELEMWQVIAYLRDQAEKVATK